MGTEFSHGETRAAVMAAIARYCASYEAAVLKRNEELLEDSNDHLMIAAAFGLDAERLRNIDRSHNEARLLYRHFGSLTQEMCSICFSAAFPGSGRRMVPNPLGGGPRNFEIDWLMPTLEAVEFKWRDATTDGDHIRKERTRLATIKSNGYVPVRLMFFLPARKGAIRIQNALRAAYEVEGGVYLAGKEAFGFVHRRTGIDLASCLKEAGVNVPA